MSRNNKNAKRKATSRTQKRTEGFKGAAQTKALHGKRNTTKYNRKDRQGVSTSGRREHREG